MDAQIVQGSLSQIAKDQNKSIAETFLSCTAIILVDTSGSMAACDSKGGKSRYQVACDELRQLQGNLPGKIAVISFSDQVLFCPSGVPFDFGNATYMDIALNYVRMADSIPNMKFILISDGCPDNENKTLAVARKFSNHIDTIYVGPESDSAGREFLEKLAAASGGKSIQDFQVKALETNIQKLLS